MAKKKKISGVAKKKAMPKASKFNFSSFAGAIGGAIVSKVIIKKLPIGNDLVKSIIPIAVGAFMSSSKNEIMKGAGFGMIAVGGGNLVSSIVPSIAGASGGILDGIFDFSTPLTMSGADEIMFLNGTASTTLDGEEEIGSDDTYIAGDGNAYMA